MKSVFISSTFKDMQAERDILHQRVFPKLRKRLAVYGEDVQELDLRWGVDTSQMSEEESGKFVIEACIDSIDRCKPYMIILLGNRYGWIPERKVVEDTGDDRIMTWCAEEASITQMEILYGALSQKDLEKCVFCFRNEDFPDSVPQALRPVYAGESPRHTEKLAKLKTEIRGREQATILDYEAGWDPESQSAVGLERFEEQLTQALWAMLSRDLGEKTTEKSLGQRVLQESNLTAERYLATYISRKMDRQDGPIALMGQQGRWYTGEGGSGKSAMMSQIAAQARKVGVKVFLYFGGNDGCGSVDVLLAALLEWLDQIDGKKPKDYSSKNREVNRFDLQERLEKKRSFDWAVLVDGVDQMEEDAVQILCWMARIMLREEKEKFWHGLAASSTKDFADRWKADLESAFTLRTLEPLTSLELHAVIQSHAARRGKKLDANVVQCIRNKEGARNPYYLSLILQKLFMMDQRDFEQAETMAPGMEGLSRYMCRELAALPEDTGEMTLAVLRSAAEKLSARMRDLPAGEGKLAEPMEVLELLAASKAGMSLEELAEVLNEQGQTFPPMFLERLFCYLYDSFGESESGVWDFKHRLLRENLVSHMGKENYQRRCVALLRHYENKADALEPRFYYAWQAGDVPAGLRCLSVKGRALESLLTVFRQMLSQDGEGYLTALSEAADAQRAEALLYLLRNVGEAAQRWQARIRPWLSRLTPGAEATAALRLRYDEVELSLRLWDLDTQAFGEFWRQAIADFGDLRPLDKSACITMYFLSRTILENGRFHELWKETAAVLETIRAACQSEGWLNSLMFESLEETCTWSALLGKGEDIGAEETPAFRQSLKAFLDNLPSGFSSSKMNAWKVYLAGLYLEAGQYHEGNEILDKGLLNVLKFGYTFSGSMERACGFVHGLLGKGTALQAKYAIPYLQKAKEICESTLKSCPDSTYWKYLLGQTGIRLWKALEKSEDGQHRYDAPKCLDTTIRNLDELVQAMGADQVPEDILLEILDQRYHRVMRRRKKGNPWKCLEEQKADFQYMETQYTALDARSDRLLTFYNMFWCLMEEVWYFDACHLEKDLLAACKKLTKAADILVETKSPVMVWAGLSAQLELAELLFRYRYSKAAASLTDQIHETFQLVDTNWVIQRKKTEEYHRRIVRFYLMKARLTLRQKGETKTAGAYLRLAADMLDGKGENQAPLPASDNTLRSEVWILFGELFVLAGKEDEASKALNSTDIFWEKSTCDSVLQSNGTLRDRIGLLRYCRGLAMRAKLRKKSQYMDRAVEYLRRLTDVAVEMRDASTWEELYDALMDAYRYYWNLGQGEALPEDLMSAMLPALGRKAEEGTLTEDERILFCQIGVEKQSCLLWHGLGNGFLPETAWLQLVLDQEKALQQPSSQNRMAARLAVDFTLRGNYEAALKTAADCAPEGESDTLRLLQILTEAINAIAEEKAPENPLTPQALAWLETPLADRETFVRVYLEVLCSLADSFDAGALEPPRRAWKLLQERAERLSKDVQKTVIPDWTFALMEQLAAAREAGADITPEEYLEILRAEDSTGGQMHDSSEDPAKKEWIVTRLGTVDLKLAEAYLAAGDKTQYNRWALGALRQTIQLKKHMTRADWQEMLRQYALLKTSRDTLSDPVEFRQQQWMQLADCGERIFQAMYQQDKSPVWMERQAAEAALYRKRLLEVEQEDIAWRQEKAAEAWDYDREAWLTLLRDRPAEREWLFRYLDATEHQIEALGEGQEAKLEMILEELYSLQTGSMEEKAAVNRVIDQASAWRRDADNDLMYLMYQALRDLGQDAQMEQVMEYIKMRRSGESVTVGML